MADLIKINRFTTYSEAQKIAREALSTSKKVRELGDSIADLNTELARRICTSERERFCKAFEISLEELSASENYDDILFDISGGV